MRVHSYSCNVDAAPAVDETLTPDDASKILEELLEAQNESLMLGLGLNLRLHEVEAIHGRYSDPRVRLLYIIIAFLKQEKPSWRVIVQALRNPIVSLPALARRVEEAHFPDPTATHTPASGEQSVIEREGERERERNSLAYGLLQSG